MNHPISQLSFHINDQTQLEHFEIEVAFRLLENLRLSKHFISYNLQHNTHQNTTWHEKLALPKLDPHSNEFGSTEVIQIFSLDPGRPIRI